MKVGMLTVHDGHAVRYPVTILQLDDVQVVQIKTLETNGYTALQLGIGEAKAQKVNMPQQVRETQITPACSISPHRYPRATLIRQV
jgi:large subunit ribosomal protein L3